MCIKIISATKVTPMTQSSIQEVELGTTVQPLQSKYIHKEINSMQPPRGEQYKNNKPQKKAKHRPAHASPLSAFHLWEMLMNSRWGWKAEELKARISVPSASHAVFLHPPLSLLYIQECKDWQKLCFQGMCVMCKEVTVLPWGIGCVFIKT